MTSQGRPLARFQRALATRNPLLIRAAASELPRIDLQPALAVLLAFVDEAHATYERAVARWVQRYKTELRPAPVDAEAELLAAALRALPAEGAGDRAASLTEAGAATVGHLLDDRGMDEAGALLDRWLLQRGTRPN